jgi:DNA repair protein RadC
VQKRACEAAGLIFRLGPGGRTRGSVTKFPGQEGLIRRLFKIRADAEGSVRERRADPGGPIGDEAYLEFLRYIFAGCRHERVLATFVGANRGYLAHEFLVDGQRSGVELGGRRLLDRAFAHAAQGVILAHNHPSGSSDPSLSDIRSTKAVIALLERVGIRLIDHLVVARNCVTSMRDGRYV